MYVHSFDALCRSLARRPFFFASSLTASEDEMGMHDTTKSPTSSEKRKERMGRVRQATQRNAYVRSSQRARTPINPSLNSSPVSGEAGMAASAKAAMPLSISQRPPSTFCGSLSFFPDYFLSFGLIETGKPLFFQVRSRRRTEAEIID